MRGLALSVAAAVLLFAAFEPVKAELVLYEGFCYGDEQRDLEGLEDGCSWGWGGPWQVVSTDPDPEESWAHYEPEGLEFGELVVARQRDCEPCGKAHVQAGHDYHHVKGVRQLGLESPPPPSGHTIWGSYLWARRTGVPYWPYSMSALLVNSPENWNGDDRNAEFFAAGDAWSDQFGNHNGGVGIRGFGKPNKGAMVADGNTYLVIFKVTDLGTTWPTITEWILNQCQFENYKPWPHGWLTEEELNTAALGIECDQVQQRQDPPLIRAVQPLHYPLDDFLGLMNYDGGILPVGMGTDFDELRISNSEGEIGLNEVTPITKTLIWDGSDGAEWGGQHWDDGTGTLVIPYGGEDMCVSAGLVNVDNVYTGAYAAISLTIGGSPGGTVSVNDTGELEVAGDVTVGTYGTLNVAGKLTAANVICDGTLSGSGTIQAAHYIEIAGVVSPGDSVGTLTVDGELELIEGRYVCEIDGTGADRVHNANEDEAILLSYEGEGGTLELLVLDGLGLPGCYTRTILSTSGAGEIEGDFPDGQKPADGECLDKGVFLHSYETVDTGAGVNYNLNLFQADIGDADGDGDVDLDDLSLLDDGWDPTATDKNWCCGDFDGNGAVDLDDLSALDDHWNPGGYPVVNCPFEGGGEGLGSAPVPEPYTLLLLIMGTVGLLACAWRKRRRR